MSLSSRGPTVPENRSGALVATILRVDLNGLRRKYVVNNLTLCDVREGCVVLALRSAEKAPQHLKLWGATGNVTLCEMPYGLQEGRNHWTSNGFGHDTRPALALASVDESGATGGSRGVAEGGERHRRKPGRSSERGNRPFEWGIDMCTDKPGGDYNTCRMSSAYCGTRSQNAI